MNKILKIAGISLVVVLVIGLIAYNRFEHWYNTSLEPVSTTSEDISFEVEEGATPDEIAANLDQAGLIKSSTAFSIYLSRTGQRTSLQAGLYKLSPAMSSQDIADIIINGKVDTRLLTIIPGLRLDEIRQSLIDAGFEPDEVNQALKATYQHPLLDSKPKKASLEGYIYPESIQIDSQTSVESVISQSFEIFWKDITDDIRKGIQEQGFTLHEAIILASMIEMESADVGDQVKIARVFKNRLDEGMVLGSDVTFKYAAAIEGVEPRVDLDSPYNTRIYPGLPPGPISNFTISALEAVAYPANGDWLYFVSGDNGNTYFSNTFEEHEANIEKYCDELCRL